MSINLQKGQKIDLTKGGTGLKHIMVGLGWDEAQQSSSGGGFLGLFKSKPADIDCDASAILCNSDGKYIDLVYYRNLQTSNGSIVHQGDNLTGAGDGDDEQIMVDLSKVSPSVGKIVFVVNIYQASDRKQHFGMIQNAFIRLVDMDKNNEICRYNLSDNYYGMEGLIVGEIYRYNGEWKFNAIGQPVQSASHVDKLTAMYK
ncbi:MAG: TerD family protein [Oribacterium sp.]|nr:TerD family protein [Oribacterium sp.]